MGLLGVCSGCKSLPLVNQICDLGQSLNTPVKSEKDFTFISGCDGEMRQNDIDSWEAAKFQLGEPALIRKTKKGYFGKLVLKTRQ